MSPEDKNNLKSCFHFEDHGLCFKLLLFQEIALVFLGAVPVPLLNYWRIHAPSAPDSTYVVIIIFFPLAHMIC